MVEDFCDTLQISRTDHLLPANESFSFRNSTGTASSLIDHFLVSRHLLASVKSLHVIDSCINLSDHIPLCMQIVMRNVTHADSPLAITPCSYIPESLRVQLRWDKADKDMYYAVTYEYLRSVVVPVSLYCDTPNELVKADIEYFYCGIINALQQAARTTVPHKKFNFFKHWWDDELNEAKQRSINSHRSWVDSGKPKSGLLYVQMLKSRKEYKLLIKTKDKNSKDHFSNELNDALHNKTTDSF